MAKSTKASADADIREALDKFRSSQESSDFNRSNFYDDFKFARLSEQWPEHIRQQREQEGRPALVVNKLPSMIRSVVNEARQNSPSIKVSPVDSGADEDTAEVISGLMRSIQDKSAADVAYDTAIDHAVTGGFGFFRIDIDYAHDESFDLEARINRIANPLSVHWDTSSTRFDAADWDFCFVSDFLSKEEYEVRYPDASLVPFDGNSTDENSDLWMQDETIRVAEYFQRIPKSRKLLQLAVTNQEGGTDLHAVREDELPAMAKRFFEAGMVSTEGMSDKDLIDGFMEASGVQVLRERDVEYFDVVRKIINGVEVLEEDKWPGTTIPICPVWGDEVFLDGRRHFRSMIRDVKDSQMMFNFWRALDLNTLIPTPSGWTTMGEIKVGDELFDENGDICHVIGKSPVHTDKDCYEIEFTDGSKVVASGDHPWMVEERAGRDKKGFIWEYKKLTTEELEPKKHFVDVAGVLKLPDQSLPIHPYVLGQWLGDGDSSNGRLCSNERDVDKIRGLIFKSGYDLGPCLKKEGAYSYTVYGLVTDLRELDLIKNKHIPNIYLRGSVEQRWNLLQGLMDSDGSYNPSNNTCGFVTTNGSIAKAFGELLSTLGFKYTYVVREPRNGRANGVDVIGKKKAYQFSFTAYSDEPVFGIRNPLPDQEVHKRRTKRYGIKSVTPIDPVHVQCIGIDAPSHLFLCGESMIPTHNSASTEIVALAPKAPFIGPRGFIPKGQEQKWASANNRSYTYLEYEGNIAPQRQPFPGVPAGMIQESVNASTDMQDVTGIYPAAIGAKSNETSGKAILARERQGDTANFHFIDNLNRAIEYAGRVLVEIIPSVYSPRETIRILGEDSSEKVIKLTQEAGGSLKQGVDGQQRLYNLSVGKYDVTVSSGPSFATQREETRETLIEIMRAVPAAANFVGDVLLDHMDFVGADKVAKRLKALLPPEVRQAEDAEAHSDDPEKAALVQQNQALQQQMQQAQQAVMAEIEKIKKENEALKQSKQIEMQRLQLESQYKGQELMLKDRELKLKEAETFKDKPEPTYEEQWEYDRSIELDKLAWQAAEAEKDRELEREKLRLQLVQDLQQSMQCTEEEAEEKAEQIIFQRDERGNIMSAIKAPMGEV